MTSHCSSSFPSSPEVASDITGGQPGTLVINIPILVLSVVILDVGRAGKVL